ncbi:anti-sigma factor [Mesobacillus selenatarsenatis]|uniref:Sigma-M negative effector n=1 Tax=Mesobacillus selenatarsenatis (strain DSM 18680 / JCM 14380 / FERM P-15431 / SF-1) TaxID=1321606 RepID=A0A0A8XBE1_MESS1|nr:anti-sigma factor [Mesobacillus selenatarsenatis]GAM15456.1 sigma-M negative effector [Mesobacillus selenatarsenatis SF-1]
MNMEWTKDKEKKILLKYRFTLTVKIIRIIAATLFFFWLYMLVISISYHSLGLDKKHIFYSRVAMDWSQPNMQEDFGSIDSAEITPFFTQKISYPVYKMIGKETELIGTKQLAKRLAPMYSTNQTDYLKPKNEQEYTFYLPEHPKTGTKLEANEDPAVWTKLEKVHEGTVAELSFSTKSYMTPEEMLGFLKPYDLDVLWMPLYAGEMKEFETGWGGSGNTLSVDSIGFTGGREAGDDYNSQSKYSLEEKFSELNKKLMLQQMKNLLDNESTSYRENFLGLSHLEERYNYLMKEGFQVYGAVVTGPVKELLKLKENEQIQGANLGEMTYWNWSEE